MDNVTRARNRIGKKYISNEGLEMEIIECFNSTNCTIRFKNGVTLKNRNYEKIKAGKVKNPYFPSVYNIGFIGEGNIIKNINGKHTEAYQQWTGMLERCYDEKFHLRHPTYKNCTVTKEWLNFQNFGEWFEKNYIESYHLDKDILIKGNKVYSPITCCFVPQEINKLLQKSDKIRGKYPIGVRMTVNSLQASITINGKYNYLGAFKNINDAFLAYKQAKEQYIKEIADKFKDRISFPVYYTLMHYNVEITD